MRSGFVGSWVLVVVTLSALLALSSGSGQNGLRKQKLHDRQQANPAHVNRVSDSVTNLAQKIALSIATPSRKTEIFSPFSIAGGLSLLLLGSSGRTKQELLRVMGFNEDMAKEFHNIFARQFQDLASNDSTIVPLVPWRLNDKCNQHGQEDNNENFETGNTSNNTKDLKIHAENAIFAKEGTTFDSRYSKLAKDTYKSELQQLDFKHNAVLAVQTINNWINNVTHGRIAHIVPHVHPETVMMIVNTLYFRANWEEPFQPFSNQPFFPNGPKAGRSFDVPMMTKRGCMPYYFWAEASIHVLGIPYKQNVTMYILMPMNSTRELVQALQPKINADNMNDLVTKMEMKFVTLLMPKMHVISLVSLTSVLKQLGLTSLFKRGKANLNNLISSRLSKRSIDNNCASYENVGVGRSACLMNNNCDWVANKCVCCLSDGNEDMFRRRRREASTSQQKKTSIYVNEMLHKVDFTVSEVGTERGADSDTVIDKTSSQDAGNFIVNGPFLMIIREEATGMPLLYGAVYNPK